MLSPLCAIALFLSLLVPAPGQGVTVHVRLLYLKNGRPAGRRGWKIDLILGDPARSPRILKATPSSNGTATFHIPRPLPKTVFVLQEDGLIRGCAAMPSIPLEDVLNHGVTIGVDKEFGPACGGEKALRKLKGIHPKPGEIIVFVRKLHWWEKMQW